MENNILERGSGYLGKVTVDSVHGYAALKGRKNKRLYIKLLKDEADENVCLVAYCILDSTAHFIVKGNTQADIDGYVARVNSRYDAEYDFGKVSKGYPFRVDYELRKLRSEELTEAIAYIHALAPCAADSYDFNSYSYLYEGQCGGTAVIIAENGGNMSRQQFLSLLGMGSRRSYGSGIKEKEKLKAVIKDLSARYLNRPNVEEKVVVFVLASICDRCRVGYLKAAKALGFKKGERRDLMISTLCDMITRRGHGFSDSVEIMQLYGEDRNVLLIECIVELNRIYQYSYDHIISVFGIKDYYYDIVVEIFRDLNRRFNYNFEELCLKFHLQNDIISIRNRCGF